jgi:hypothetical protein
MDNEEEKNYFMILQTGDEHRQYQMGIPRDFVRYETLVQAENALVKFKVDDYLHKKEFTYVIEPVKRSKL